MGKKVSKALEERRTTERLRDCEEQESKESKGNSKGNNKRLKIAEKNNTYPVDPWRPDFFGEAFELEIEGVDRFNLIVQNFPGNCKSYIVHGFPRSIARSIDNFEIKTALIGVEQWARGRYADVIVLTLNDGYQANIIEVAKSCGYTMTFLYGTPDTGIIWMGHKELKYEDSSD